MPYALFCNESKLSKTYPTEADVWKLARQSGLVVDAVSEAEKAAPRPVLDNDYEIRPCRPDPHEDPAKNKAEAEQEAELEFQLSSEGAYPPAPKTRGIGPRLTADGQPKFRAKAADRIAGVTRHLFSAGLKSFPAAVPLVHAKCLICRGIFVGTQVA